MSRTQVLSTVPLEQPLIERAGEEGIKLDVMPFIETKNIITEEQKKEIDELFELPITAVFTSANAVKAIKDIIGSKKPEWTIYCLGGATQKAVEECFDVHALTKINIANDAASLAGMIIEDDVCEVVFFCGDKRMDTLPDALQEHEITMHEEVVYETVETPQLVTKYYDGILFFSPSGVNSFYSANRVDVNTVLFAIGDTTANAIRAKTGKEPVTGKKHAKESLVEEAIQYFHKQAAAIANAGQ